MRVNEIDVVTRMTQDLHDGPLQDVFATMIRLETLSRMAPTDVAEELRMLSALQSRVIRQLREVCQDPRGERVSRPATEEFADVVDDGSIALGFVPERAVDSRFDSIDDRSLVRDVLLVTRECLSNVARHAHATHVSVTLSIRPSWLSLTVRDNGLGLSTAARRGNGLANLRLRAERHDGSFVTTTPSGGGTVVRWRVPLNRAEDQYGSTGEPDTSSRPRRTAAV